MEEEQIQFIDQKSAVLGRFLTPQRMMNMEQKYKLSNFLIDYSVSSRDEECQKYIIEFIVRVPDLAGAYSELSLHCIRSQGYPFHLKTLFKQIAFFPNLQRLDLSGLPVSDKEMCTAQWLLVPRLNYLNCKDCYNLTNSSLMAFQNMPHLTHLNLLDTAISPDILQFGFATGLKSLGMDFKKNYCRIEPFSDVWSSLTYLNIPTSNRPPLLTLFPSLQNLTALHLCNEGNELPRLGTLTQLASLSLKNSPPSSLQNTRETLGILPNFMQLTHLSLENLHVSKTFFSRFDVLKKLTSLRSLSLEVNNFGTRMLEFGNKLTRLETLNLRHLQPKGVVNCNGLASDDFSSFSHQLKHLVISDS